MSAASYRRYYADNHDLVLRLQAARRRAERLGLRIVQRGSMIRLFDSAGNLVESGGLDYIEAYLGERFAPRQPGPPLSAPPVKWRPLVEMFVTEQNAAKRRPGTTRLRVMCLNTFARAHPGSDPLTVTRNDLVQYLNRSEWTPQTAHSVRSTFRVFFRLLCDLGHRRDDPARTLPAIKIPRAVPRPCPDHIVQQAYPSVADQRVRLAIRIAVEAGLRRGEVAQVHTRDLIEGAAGAQLLVHGKGGKKRVVPISDSLAQAIRRGPAGHTPGAPADGWLFPARDNGPVTAQYVGQLVADALPDNWTMHTLRHRFATRAYRGTRNLRAVQVLLGHESIATTERYCAVGDSEIRAAMVAAQ